MPCDPTVFEEIPIFSPFDADERAVLAEQVELRRFRARHRIYKAGDPGGKAHVVPRGRVQVIVIDENNCACGSSGAPTVRGLGLTAGGRATWGGGQRALMSTILRVQ